MFQKKTNFYQEPDPYKFEPLMSNTKHSVEALLTYDDTIDNLNLDKIIVKSMDSYSGYGWDADTAFQLANLYRVFLFLCKTYPTEVIVPIKEVDEFWHLHILDTRSYIVDCDTIFGYYLHHYPYAGLPGSSSTEEKEDLFKVKTLDLIEKHFPQLLSEN